MPPGPARIRQVTLERLHQRRLADPRLPGHQHEPTRAAPPARTRPVTPRTAPAPGAACHEYRLGPARPGNSPGPVVGLPGLLGVLAGQRLRPLRVAGLDGRDHLRVLV